MTTRVWGRAVGRLLVVIVMALVLVPAGFASGGGQKSSSVAGYSGVGGSTQTKVNDGGSNGPTASAGTTSTLPFTGIDLAYVLVGGFALVGVGMAVRRASRPRDLAS
jgi:hypothetical protein